MKSKTCCFTGHRALPADRLPQIKQRLEEEILKLVRQGVVYFGAGGALGFDTLAAQTILNLKQFYPQIRLILVLPCKEQDRFWPEADRVIYRDILSRADKVVYTAERYDPGCMHRRNRHLVDHSGVCLCYQTQPSGGAAYTVRYAKSRGLRVINLAD